jgi:hypothetical protein
MIDELVMQGKICPYCGNASVYTDSAVIYGKSYGMVYWCKPCDAYVGVHKSQPELAFGRLANAELRASKKLAHYYFDRLWKGGFMKRQSAYKWLSIELGTAPELTHIGMFDNEQCNKVAELSKGKLELA